MKILRRAANDFPLDLTEFGSEEHTNNVFISWSGSRSKWAAQALREWLPIVLQAARPWMSETDIEKGSRGLDAVGRALEGMKIGIICLTPENLAAEWILFEAGALSKTLDAKTRVCTYLLAELKPQNIKAPLGMFQWTRADKDDTRKLVHTINKALDVTPVPDGNLDAAFDGLWPRLEEKLAAMPSLDTSLPETRPIEEMVAEILALSRAATNSRKDIERLDPYIPLMEQLLPLVSEAMKSVPQLNSPLQKQLSKQDGRVRLVCLKFENAAETHRVEGVSVSKDEEGSIAVFDETGQCVARLQGQLEKCWFEDH